MRRQVQGNTDDKPTATPADEMEALVTENKSLRDRLLRALADAENTRRRADQAGQDARKFAIADFAREILLVDPREKKKSSPSASIQLVPSPRSD